jgi:hypothetical protein
MPRSLLGRLIVRILALEWFAFLALILTTAAVVFAFARSWGWAAFGGFAVAAAWGYIVNDENRPAVNSGRTRSPFSERESDG